MLNEMKSAFGGNIKKFLVGTAAGALMLGSMVVPAFAKVETVPGPWDLTGICEIAYTGVNIAPGPYVHTYNVDTVNLVTGEFSGIGFYNPNPAYTELIDGTVTGSTFDFDVDYTGLNPSYALAATGTIAPDGTISGSATSNTGQEFTFASTSSCATRIEGNHGQYVSSQENKQEAAQSRVGMPVQSKGHTQ